MNLPLFRKQAVDYQKDRLYGELILIQPVSFSILSFFLILVTAAILFFLVTNTYTKKEKVSGIIVPRLGMVSVFPPQAGILDKLSVTEGMSVKLNDELFSVMVDQKTNGGKYIGQKLIEELDTQESFLFKKLIFEKERVDAEIAARKAESKRLQNEIARLKELINIQSETLNIEKQTYEKAKIMLAEDFISANDTETFYRKYLDQKQQYHSLEMEMEQAIANLEEIPIYIRALKVNSKNEILSIDSQISEIAKQRTQVEGQRQLIFTAPVSGRITSIVVNAGQRVDTSIPLFSIIPEGSKLQANLYVPTRSIGFLKIGQSVNVSYEAFPYQKFGTHAGTVGQIPESVIMPGESASGISFQEPVYKVVAELKSQKIIAYGKKIPLRPGMILSADITLDERSLFEWLLEPIYSLKGKL